MKRLVTLSVLTAVAGAVAQAQDYKAVCARGDNERVIEVVTPGEVGETCDVRYTRGPDDVRIPYHADNAQSFCETKAKELTAELTTAGFSCAFETSDAVSARPLREAEAASPDGPSDYVVEARRTPETDVQETEPAVDEQLAALATGADDEPVPSEPNTQALNVEMESILAEPPQRQADSGGPADLIASAETTISAGAPAPNAPAGRLVGATPETPSQKTKAQGAAAPTPAAMQTTLDEPASASVQQDSALRAPQDVIRATLNAQAAAWNEGDLEAFMETYWKDDAMKFVSGSTITKGWSAVMKRYREKYAGANGLGLLGFERMDVQMVTDDVAVVTGRFNHTSAEESSKGAFTLVMKRMDGVWRIVHDHTNTDPAPTQ